MAVTQTAQLHELAKGLEANESNSERSDREVRTRASTVCLADAMKAQAVISSFEIIDAAALRDALYSWLQTHRVDDQSSDGPLEAYTKREFRSAIKVLERLSAIVGSGKVAVARVIGQLNVEQAPLKDAAAQNRHQDQTTWSSDIALLSHLTAEAGARQGFAVKKETLPDAPGLSLSHACDDDGTQELAASPRARVVQPSQALQGPSSSPESMAHNSNPGPAISDVASGCPKPEPVMTDPSTIVRVSDVSNRKAILATFSQLQDTWRAHFVGTFADSVTRTACHAELRTRFANFQKHHDLRAFAASLELPRFFLRQTVHMEGTNMPKAVVVAILVVELRLLRFTQDRNAVQASVRKVLKSLKAHQVDEPFWKQYPNLALATAIAFDRLGVRSRMPDALKEVILDGDILRSYHLRFQNRLDAPAEVDDQKAEYQDDKIPVAAWPVPIPCVHCRQTKPAPGGCKIRVCYAIQNSQVCAACAIQSKSADQCPIVLRAAVPDADNAAQDKKRRNDSQADDGSPRRRRRTLGTACND